MTLIQIALDSEAKYETPSLLIDFGHFTEKMPHKFSRTGRSTFHVLHAGWQWGLSSECPSWKCKASPRSEAPLLRIVSCAYHKLTVNRRVWRYGSFTWGVRSYPSRKWLAFRLISRVSFRFVGLSESWDSRVLFNIHRCTICINKNLYMTVHSLQNKTLALLLL